MPVSVESARQEWDESHRRLVAQARDANRYDRLLAQVEAIETELRRRLGSTFTLAELAEVYAGAERWSLIAVQEHAPAAGAPTTLALVEGAAFHHYAREAADFSP